MLLIDEIIEDYSLRKEIVSQVEHSYDIEMSEHDSAFLCGLIKNTPQKKFWSLESLLVGLRLSY